MQKTRSRKGRPGLIENIKITRIREAEGQKPYNKVKGCIYTLFNGCKGCKYNQVPELYDGGCMIMRVKTEDESVNNKTKA